MASPVSKLMKPIVQSGKWDTMKTEIQDKIQDASPSEVSQIVEGVFIKNNMAEWFSEAVLNAIVDATKVSVDVTDELTFRHFYSGGKTVDGEKLSAKLREAIMPDSSVKLLKDSVQVSDKWNAAAEAIAKDAPAAVELPAYVDTLLQRARQAASLADDPKLYGEYRQAVNAVLRQAEGLVDTDKSGLAQAYRNLAKATDSASSEVLDKAVERAIIEKARSNAARTARTELSRAYANGVVYDAQQDPDATAIKVSLSGAHDHSSSPYCMCDFFTETDLYGLGDGIFPKDELPEFPFHPNCTCLLEPWYGDAEDAKYNDQAGADAFDDLEESDQKAIAGKDGEWDDVNWDSHELPDGIDEVVK